MLPAMARRKSDAEVGPLGVWAYNTRDALDLSVEAVVAALPTHYHPATLRKVEGGSSVPGRRMWRELAVYYGRVAAEKDVLIEPQPRLIEETDTADAPDLATALVALTAELTAMREEREALWRGIAGALRSDVGERVAEALLDVLAPLLPEPAPELQPNGSQ